jgi:CheY-like chemotaxis protein
LVEDREDDIILIRRSFKIASLKNPLHVVRTGEEALAYLNGEGKYSMRAEYPLPILVLLDLKLPGMDGFEVLKWIRAQPGLRGLPVVVLTCSTEIRDVNRAYQLGANSFFVKELEFEQSVDVADLIRRYWVNKSLKPESSRPDRDRTEA